MIYKQVGPGYLYVCDTSNDRCWVKIGIVDHLEILLNEYTPEEVIEAWAFQLCASLLYPFVFTN